MGNGQNVNDVILVGGGIMCATLGTFIKEVQPDWKIMAFERLDKMGQESTEAWNNAGTGHSALCELNYTPEKKDGSVDVSKAIKINEQYQLSRQFWAYLLNTKQIDSSEFIQELPHMSWVQGADTIKFLKKRHAILSQNPLFAGMEYTEDPKVVAEWSPLMMEGRTDGKPMAATKVNFGTDVDFGKLTIIMFDNLKRKGVDVRMKSHVSDVKRNRDGLWEVTVKGPNGVQKHLTKFVFLGNGGGSILLLQKSGIPEGKTLGSFPVSGVFLACDKQEVVKKHNAKVYGKAPMGAPPMSVPHLDTRVIDGKKYLMFGPYAGFSTNFLKNGSYFDLLKSLKLHNLKTLMGAAVNQMVLTKYLINQVLLSHSQRVKEIRDFVPTTKDSDWFAVRAGQRVQIIKNTEKMWGDLVFGTEVISASDGSLASLLGASPGASVAVDVMLELMKKCFPQNFKSWEPKIKEMIPSFGQKLEKNPELLKQTYEETNKAFGFKAMPADLSKN